MERGDNSFVQEHADMVVGKQLFFEKNSDQG